MYKGAEYQTIKGRPDTVQKESELRKTHTKCPLFPMQAPLVETKRQASVESADRNFDHCMQTELYTIF